MTKEVFDRMITEFQELSEKTNKCREFILDQSKFNKLDNPNKDLLIAQLKSMETYISILSIRIGINSQAIKSSEDSQKNSETVEISE